ncbi:MAG: selenoprotein O [Robiginitomaculum sp.]|nr:MAG: selenoprotein O [Robiginitomaculum sp.]
MPLTDQYAADPQFPGLGPDFADPVKAADFPQTVLRFRHQEAAQQIGLDALGDTEWIAHFGRFSPLPKNMKTPLALRYHGHQFRQYNADLGDGRGFLFAQIRDYQGRLMDLGTKGSGRTPWSRAGDGRLTLKGAVREVLAAQMLAALGVPTSRVLSVIETGESLMRGDEPSPTRSAVLVRLSHSHIRFGSFQRLAMLGKKENMKTLLDHCLDHYMADLLPLSNAERPAAFLARTAQLNAQMTARWIAAGFVHGVLNTDNMNINGESFDYGPWRFLPHYEPGFTAAYFDHQGLFAFGRQGEAVSWNLARLGEALSLLAPVEDLQEAHKDFAQTYAKALPEAFIHRLGLVPQGQEQNQAFLRTILAGLKETKTPYEGFFFDWFCADSARAQTRPRLGAYQHSAFDAFKAALKTYTPDRPERLDHAYFNREDPFSLEIETVEAIWDPIAKADDWAAFHGALEGISTLRSAYNLSHSSI